MAGQDRYVDRRAEGLQSGPGDAASHQKATGGGESAVRSCQLGARLLTHCSQFSHWHCSRLRVKAARSPLHNVKNQSNTNNVGMLRIRSREVLQLHRARPCEVCAHGDISSTLPSKLLTPWDKTSVSLSVIVAGSTYWFRDERSPFEGLYVIVSGGRIVSGRSFCDGARLTQSSHSEQRWRNSFLDNSGDLLHKGIS